MIFQIVSVFVFLVCIKAQYTLTLSPANIIASPSLRSNISLSIAAMNGAVSWSQFNTEHARKLHVIIMSSDMQIFMHVHPEDFSNISDTATFFPIFPKIPRSGRYVMMSTFVINGSESKAQAYFTASIGSDSSPMNIPTQAQSLSRVVAGLPMAAKGAYVDPIDFSQTPASGYNFSLAINSPSCSVAVAGTCTRLHLSITDGSGKAATDLQPWLSAYSHIAIISYDLATTAHEHAMLDMGPMSCPAPSPSSTAGQSSTPSPMAGMNMRRLARPRRALLQVPSSNCAPMSMGGMDSLPPSFPPPLDAFFAFPAAGYYKVVFQVARADGTLLTADFQLAIAQTAPAVAPTSTVPGQTTMKPSPAGRSAPPAAAVSVSAGAAAVMWLARRPAT